MNTAEKDHRAFMFMVVIYNNNNPIHLYNDGRAKSFA